MSRGRHVQTRPGTFRSPRAAQAHAAGQVHWTVDLTQRRVDAVAQRAAASRNRTRTLLAMVATALWIADLGMLFAHVR